MRFGTAIVAATIFVCATPLPVAAEEGEPPNVARARELFVQGTELFREENYQGAYEAFAQSYELNAVNSVLYNMAMCQMALFHYVEAIDLFRRYVAAGGDRVPTERQAEIERHIADMESRLGELRLSGIPDGGEVFLDGDPWDSERWASGRLRTGRHTLRVAAPGYREQIRQIEVAAGEPTILEIELEPEEPEGPERPPVYRRWWFWTIIGVAVAGGVVTGVALGTADRDELGTGDWNVRLP